MAHVVNARPPMSIETPTETYRLIIFASGGTDVLVVPDRDQVNLPSIAIPRWQRVAETLTTEARKKWGEEVICLFKLEDVFTQENGCRVDYQVTEHRRTTGTLQMPTRWEPMSRLSENSFVDGIDYRAICLSAAKCRGNTGLETRPFAQLGWFQKLRDWIEDAIKSQGLSLTNDFRQFNAGPAFALVRFETDGAAVWFKAVGKPNQREFAITGMLAELFPNHLPEMLAVWPDWNGWLAVEVEGPNLGEIHAVAPWEEAAGVLAKLQIESIDHCARILDAGAHDLRTAALERRVDSFVETTTRAMERQAKVPPAILTENEVQLLGRDTHDAIRGLDDLGFPDALGNLDLNPANIIVSPRSCVFLDWAEAYVGNPLFSLQYLLEHARRFRGLDLSTEARIKEAYREPWKQVVTPRSVAQALSLSPFLAVFAYAIGSRASTDEKTLQEPLIAGYLRSLTRRMNREAIRLRERRSLCAL